MSDFHKTFGQFNSYFKIFLARTRSFESNKIDFIFNYSLSQGNVEIRESEKYTYRVLLFCNLRLLSLFHAQAMIYT